MCGIIGSTDKNEAAVKASLHSFAYRGPDAQGYFTDSAISLGHARLSIIDLDARANQPFFDENRELAIVFNGEIYNFKELRAELERDHAVHFRTSSDTEVLLQGYREWGEDLLPKLRGMFAFAVYDLRRREVFLARDHAGIKPLYFSLAGGALRFASELKGVRSLLERAGIPVEVDRHALGLYTVFGYVPSPRTLVRNIEKLSRGSWLRYRIDGAKVERGLWKPQTRAVGSRAELEDAIRRSVLEHCVSDVPVGTFFSGGVDSSLISAVLKDAGRDLETFSIRVSGRPADAPYFTEIAQRLGVRAHVADFGTKEFDELYDDVLSKIDDPIADASIFPTALVSRIASAHVKVVLSGEGGDELFLGYPRALRIARMRRPRAGLVSAFDRAYFGTPPFRGKTSVFAEAAARLGSPATYYLEQTSLAHDRSDRGAWGEARQMLEHSDPLWLDRDWYLENMLLRKTDMATSYASIEGRVPLLGVELWNAAPAFAHDSLEHEGGKEILRSMLARYVPRELIDRPKAGFGASLTTLFRESSRLRVDVQEALPIARDLGIADMPEEAELIERYPAYAYGLVVLVRALHNLGLA